MGFHVVWTQRHATTVAKKTHTRHCIQPKYEDPTGEDFFLLFRFYGPEKPVIDKSWVLPDVEKVK